MKYPLPKKKCNFFSELIYRSRDFRLSQNPSVNHHFKIPRNQTKIPTYFSENKFANFYKKLKVRYKIEYFHSPRKKIEMVKYKSLIIKNLHVTAIKGSLKASNVLRSQFITEIKGHLDGFIKIRWEEHLFWQKKPEDVQKMDTWNQWVKRI